MKGKNLWEDRNTNHLLQNLVGSMFGDYPVNKQDAINQFKKNEAKWLINFLNPEKNDVVIDLGSGIGSMAGEFSNYVKEVHCCDISNSFLKFAKKNLKGVDNVYFHFLKARPAVFNLPENSIDLIYANAVFIHLNIYDIYWYFSEAHKVLKKGGRFYMTILNVDSLDIDSPLFTEMTNLYKLNSSGLQLLTMWNSKNYIMKLADHFKFKLVKEEIGGNDHLLFAKKR